MGTGRRPLENRVTPFGDVVGIAQRGLFIGNRGIIHDVATKTLLGRRWTTKAWLRLQGAAPGGDGRPQLDRAFLSRRSGGARGRASPVLLLPPRGGRGISHRLGQGEGREGASSAGEISFIASICSRIFFGRVSSHIPGELKQALDKAADKYELKVFSGTQYGFCFPERAVFDTIAAEETWTKIFAMWDRNLK